MTPKNRLKLAEALKELTFGLECEVTGISLNSARMTADRINRANGLHGTRKAFKAVYDGSVTSGAEFVSGIMKWDEDMPATQEAVRAIHRAGGRAHISCGIHVHIGAKPFIENPKALVRLIRTVYRYENQLFHALGADTPERRGRWARPVSEAFMARIDALGKNPTIDQIRTAWYADNPHGTHRNYHNSRYRMLNLHALFNKGTVEFRCFNSSTHAGEVRTYITLCAHICAYALIARSCTTGRRSFDRSRAKYEVRTFGLKIGLIGEGYGNVNKHLTKHCSGDSSRHRQ